MRKLKERYAIINLFGFIGKMIETLFGICICGVMILPFKLLYDLDKEL